MVTTEKVSARGKTADRRKLLRLLMRDKGLAPTSQRIARRSQVATEPVPLSFAQYRIWFLCKLDSESAFYNTPMAVELEGPLAIASLRRALNRIVMRHEALRTRFQVIDGEPFQVVEQRPDLELPLVDLGEIPERQRRRLAREKVDEAVREPFDLVRGPMIRFRLLRLSAHVHWLLILTHHLVFDGWSVAVFGRELKEFYTAQVTGVPPQLPELPIQYADFSLWQRQWLRGETLERQLREAESRLLGAPPILALPSDRPRLAVQTYRGRTQTFALQSQLTQALQTLSRRYEVTLFSTLLAVFKILLYRYTGQKDMVVSAGVANRNRSETEPLIGCFINILLLRTDLGAHPSFRQALRSTHQSVIDALAQQDLPFERLVARLRPKRDTSFSPLTQVMIVFHNTGLPEAEMAGLRLRQIEAEKSAAQYDLLLHLRHIGDEIYAVVEYNTDLFDSTTITRWIGHFQHLAESVAQDKERDIACYPVLSRPESHAILAELNDCTQKLGEACLHELFERHAAHRPDAVAVQFGGSRITYGDLDRRAARRARHLMSLGVGPDTVVGICVERSPRLIEGCLGILKAGGAYLPLDPIYPAERLSLMIRDSGVKIFLSQQHLADRLPNQEERTVIDLDREPTEADEPPAGRPPDPENLAYVIFTSGSTGRPKGIAVRHRGVVNNLLDLNTRFEVSENDTALALSATSFDMSVYEFFGLLAAGGTVLIPEGEHVRDAIRWLHLIKRHRVSVWNTAPSLLELLVETAEARPDEADLGSLRLALLGGDWVPVTLPDRLKALASEMDFIVLGGATEASIHSIIFPVRATDPDWRSIPYGRPMTNQEAYLLSPEAVSVPIGVPGELYLGGRGLARGYLNQPGLTAERFLPHANGREPGGRIYRTGDLARWQQNGQIELLGRIDYQVKIRGLRIEPGEISAALNRHPAVREAVVLLRKDDSANPPLVAYVVGPGEQEVPEIKSFLRLSVPDYMVPYALVCLDEMPLSPNGKIMRSALRPPTNLDPEQTSYVAPENEMEAMLQETWSRLMGIADISVTADFFELGGDSFQAIRIVQQLPGALSVIDMMRNPSIRELAQLLNRRKGDSESLLYWFAEPHRHRRTMICVPYGGGSAIVYQKLAEHLKEVCVVGAVTPPGHDVHRDDEPLWSIEETAAACVEDIRASCEPPVVLYGHCAGVALTVELASRLESSGFAVEKIFLGAGVPWARSKTKRLFARLMRQERFGDERSALSFIQSLGGFQDVDTKGHWKFLIRALQHDASCAELYFARTLAGAPRDLSAPIVCFIGEQDPLTRGYRKSAKQWKHFSDSLELVVVRNGGHYFVKDRAAELAELIAARLNPDTAGPDRNKSATIMTSFKQG